jgi:hypothetical protein
VTRSFQSPEAQPPSRKTMLLIYASCVVIPFAVATVAYGFRAVLSSPSPKANLVAKQTTQSLAQTVSLVPSAQAAPTPTTPGVHLPAK